MEISRAFGILVVEGGVLCLALPGLAHLRLRWGMAGLLFLGLAGLAATGWVGGGLRSLPVLAGAQAGILAFGFFLLGAARSLRRWVGEGGLAVASLVGLLVLASPFLTDAYLEEADGRVRPGVREATLGVNPLMAAASPALLGFDWLRQPLAYQRLKLGQFHAYEYPDPLVQGLFFFLAGGLLLLLGRPQIE